MGAGASAEGWQQTAAYKSPDAFVAYLSSSCSMTHSDVQFLLSSSLSTLVSSSSSSSSSSPSSPPSSPSHVLASRPNFRSAESVLRRISSAFKTELSLPHFDAMLVDALPSTATLHAHVLFVDVRSILLLLSDLSVPSSDRGSVAESSAAIAPLSSSPSPFFSFEHLLTIPSWLVTPLPPTGFTPLHHYASVGDVSRCVLLLQRNPNLRLLCSESSAEIRSISAAVPTPANVAKERGHEEARRAIEKFDSPHDMAKRGDRASLVAFERNFGKVRLGVDGLVVEASQRDREADTELLSPRDDEAPSGYDWSLCDLFDNTPLYYAAHSGAAAKGGVGLVSYLLGRWNASGKKVPDDVMQRCITNAICERAKRELRGEKGGEGEGKDEEEDEEDGDMGLGNLFGGG